MKKILKKDIPTLIGLEPIESDGRYIHHHILSEYITDGWKSRGLEEYALRKIVNSLVFMSSNKNVYIIFIVKNGSNFHASYAFMGASKFYLSRPKHFLVVDEKL